MNIVYIDDLTIQDPGQLALLCLIYDRVSLPHPYDHDPDCEEIMRISFKNEGYREIERRNYRAWKAAHKELFDSGSLSVLPAPISVADLPSDIDVLLRGQLGPNRLRLATDDLLYGRIALAMHAVFSKSEDSEYKIAPNGVSVADLRNEMASASIRWRAPMLPKLTPEQILELLSETAPFRDGFVYYLDSLANAVEDRMGRTGENRNSAAREIFERQVRPEVAEFIRRGLPARVAWWGTILKQLGTAGGKVIETTVNPFDLSNYSEIAKAFGSLLESTATGIADGRSNKRHAQQFLARLDVAPS